MTYIFVGFLLYLAYSIYSSKEFRRGPTFRQSRQESEEVDYEHISHEILNKEVGFYARLSEFEQIQFRKDMAWFLSHTNVTGIGVKVDELERHLVAASAVIPIFYFEGWHFYELDEVLLFKGPINFQFETDAEDSQILGLVGVGKMEGKMALSVQALIEGFRNKTDAHNTAIHEFIHLMDKADGRIDGLPKALMNKPYAIPWLKLIRHKMEKVKTGNSDIDEYASLNLAEFFAVSSEYFFEKPDQLKVKHPDLYHFLDNMFRGKLR